MTHGCIGPQNDASFEGSGFLGLVKLLNLLIPKSLKVGLLSQSSDNKTRKEFFASRTTWDVVEPVGGIGPMILMSQGVI